MFYKLGKSVRTPKIISFFLILTEIGPFFGVKKR